MKSLLSIAVSTCILLFTGLAWAGGTPAQSWAAQQKLKKIEGLSDAVSIDQVRGLPELIDALYSSNPVIAEAAASEIAQLQVSVSSAVPHMIERMRRVGGRDASLYALILARIGSEALPALRLALNSEDYGLRRNVCKTLTLMESEYSADRRCHL